MSQKDLTTPSAGLPGRRRRSRLVALTAAPIATIALVVAIGREVGVNRDARTARRAVAARQWDVAATPLARWLAARPRSAEAHFYRARVAFARGEGGEFFEAVARARALGYPEIELQRLTGFQLVRSGRYAEAEPLLLRVVEGATEPDPEADEALARVFLQTYKMQLAAAVLHRWMRDAPADARPYFWLTEVDRRTGVDPTVTIGHYRAALERDPGLDAARLGLAEELRLTHRTDEAAAEYAAYLVGRPDDAAALVGAGVNAIEADDETAAIDYLDRAVAAAPKNGAAWRQRARIDERRGDLPAALGRLNRAVELDPYDLESLHQRSLVLARLDRRDEAEADRRAADRVREDRAELDSLQKKLVEHPRDLDLRRSIAAWMLEHGQAEAGLRWTSAILAERPDDGATHRLLAEYHQTHGEFGLANFHRLHAGSAVERP